MSLAKQAITTAAALKILDKKDNQVESTSSNPRTLKEAFLARPLLWLVVGGIGAYVGYRVVKKIIQGKDPEQQQKGSQKGDVKQFEKQQTPTYPDAAYSGFADAIYAARHGNNIFGTQEKDIERVFYKMNNNLDVAKLIKAFGSRRLSFSFQNADLFGFLSDEMTDEEIEPINKHLISRGITYRF